MPDGIMLYDMYQDKNSRVAMRNSRTYLWDT